MLRKIRALLPVVLALTVGLAAGVAPVAASATDSSAAPTTAEELIDKMAVAAGGPDRLSQIENVSISAMGTRWILDEGTVAGSGHVAPGRYDLALAYDAAGGRIRLDYDIDHSRLGPRQVGELVDGTGGYVLGQNSVVAPPGESAMQNDRLVSVVTHQTLMNPHLLIQAALAGQAAVELAAPEMVGRTLHDVLILDRPGASPLELFVSRRTHLITKLITTESDPLRRDVELQIQYRRWRSADADVRFPQRVRIYYDRQLIQDETRTAIDVNSVLDEALFERPAGLTPVFDPVLAARGVNSHQHLQSFAALGFPLDGLQLDVQATELSPGVHWLSGGSHHSMLVEHDGGLILVDAPLNEYRATALLDFIAANFPGRPITHLVQSHHHADHAAGARTVLAEGGALAIHESASRLWKDVLTARSTVVPDAMALSPVDVELVRVPDGGFTTIGAGANAVQLHSFEQSHSDDLVMAVAGGVAFIVDYFNPFPGAPLTPEGQVVLDVIADRGLDVHTIAGGHGGFIPV